MFKNCYKSIWCVQSECNQWKCIWCTHRRESDIEMNHKVVFLYISWGYTYRCYQYMWIFHYFHLLYLQIGDYFSRLNLIYVPQVRYLCLNLVFSNHCTKIFLISWSIFLNKSTKVQRTIINIKKKRLILIKI